LFHIFDFLQVFGCFGDNSIGTEHLRKNFRRLFGLCLYEGVRIVPMNFVSAARRVGDRKPETFFAGNVRQGLDMISFTSGGGAAGANCAANAQAAIAIGRMIFCIRT